VHITTRTEQDNVCFSQQDCVLLLMLLILLWCRSRSCCRCCGCCCPHNTLRLSFAHAWSWLRFKMVACNKPELSVGPSRPNPTQPNPTHGSTQPMDNSVTNTRFYSSYTFYDDCQQTFFSNRMWPQPRRSWRFSESALVYAVNSACHSRLPVTGEKFW